MFIIICFIALTSVGLGMGILFVPDVRENYQDREVKIELVEKREEDDDELEQNQQE